MNIGSINNSRNYNVATNNVSSNSNGVAFGDLLNTRMADNVAKTVPTCDTNTTTIATDELDLTVIIKMTSSITQTSELTEEQIEMFKAKYDFENMTTNSVQFYNFMNDLYNMGIISREFDTTDLNISDFYDLANGGILTKVGESEPEKTIEELLTEAIEKYEEYYEKIKDEDVLDLVDGIFKNYYETYQMLSDIMNALMPETELV